MTGPDGIDELDDFLERKLPLRRRLSELDPLEPPAELDRIVLTRARRAIQPMHEPRLYQENRWALPVTLAATLVLSFAVLLHFNRTSPGSPVAALADASEEAMADAHGSADAKAAPPYVAQQSASAEVAAPPAATAPSAERVAAELHSVVTTARPAEDESLERRDQSAAASEADLSAARAQERTAAGQTRPEDPEPWLARIRKLQARGDTESAEREWQAFRKAWPDYVIPSQGPTR